jgi:hypothetical protein
VCLPVRVGVGVAGSWGPCRPLEAPFVCLVAALGGTLTVRSTLSGSGRLVQLALVSSDAGGGQERVSVSWVGW